VRPKPLLDTVGKQYCQKRTMMPILIDMFDLMTRLVCMWFQVLVEFEMCLIGFACLPVMTIECFADASKHFKGDISFTYILWLLTISFSSGCSSRGISSFLTPTEPRKRRKRVRIQMIKGRLSTTRVQISLTSLSMTSILLIEVFVSVKSL
jgi:hypothetical protein